MAIIDNIIRLAGGYIPVLLDFKFQAVKGNNYCYATS